VEAALCRLRVDNTLHSQANYRIRQLQGAANAYGHFRESACGGTEYKVRI